VATSIVAFALPKVINGSVSNTDRKQSLRVSVLALRAYASLLQCS
jgi:Ca2+/H+ antiporter